MELYTPDVSKSPCVIEGTNAHARMLAQIDGVKTSCFYQLIIDTVNLQLPANCPDCADASKGSLVHLYKYLGNKFPRPQGRFAFMCESSDWILFNSFDAASTSCSGTTVNAITFSNILKKLRDEYIGRNNWATFIPGGFIHTTILRNHLTYWRDDVQTTAAQWLTLIGDDPPKHTPPLSGAPVSPPSLPTTPSAPTAPPSICFSRNSVVQVRGRGYVAMENLQLGDFVQTSRSNEYSMVYSFAHIDPAMPATFFQIHTNAFEDPLEVSTEHMVYVLRRGAAAPALLPAGKVRVGDSLLSVNGTSTPVLVIDQIQSEGVFAPHTFAGELLVNGVVASNYAAMDLAASPELQWFFQHGLDAPRRMYCYLSVDSCQTEWYVNGLSLRGVLQLAFARWIAPWPASAQLLFLVLVAPAPALLLLMEQFMLFFAKCYCHVVAACIVGTAAVTLWMVRRPGGNIMRRGRQCKQSSCMK
jgi:hypothetical protein